METTSSTWLDDVKKRVAQQRANTKLLAESEPLEESGLSKLDSSLKKLTAFMKKTKSISSTNTATQLLPELEKLNLLKFLDEIASNICETKIKHSEINDLVIFVVQLSCKYHQFPELLLAELKKNLPFRRADKVYNPNRLKFDLKFLSELVLNGMFGKPGVDLLGGVLAYLVQTDTSEFVHVPILMPFCKSSLFEFIGLIPLSEKHKFEGMLDELEELQTNAFTENNRRAVKTLLKNYYDNLIKEVNSLRIKMNKIHKSIKRQERTRGDAAQTDRQDFESTKQAYEKMKQLAVEFGELLGMELPQMVEEPSDDENDELSIKQLEGDLTEGRTSLWPDKDTLNFYEMLVPLKRPDQVGDDAEVEEVADETAVEHVAFAESVDAVDLTELENQSAETSVAVDEFFEEDEAEEVLEELPHSSSDVSESQGADKIFSLMHKPQFAGMQMHTFLENLSSAMNRDLIDSAATYFVQSLSKKANRKKLIHHFLNSPRDRLDLLPFYGRFLATINKILPDIPAAVVNDLLIRFRAAANAKLEKPKLSKQEPKKARKIDEGVFLCRFLAELTKFKILPKAEALSCLRMLLVTFKSYKVDMAAVMIEAVGVFLFRSTDTHAKMKIVLGLVQKKMAVIKDPKHKILLENAYFSVIPPEESYNVSAAKDPLKAYISILVRSIASEKRGRDPIKILKGIDWKDSNIVNYLCSQLSDVCSIKYDNLPDVADAVRTLSDTFFDIGVFVADSVVETIRIALETNRIAHQQRLLCSVTYLNWLYICGVCDFATIVQVLYQTITLGLNLDSLSLEQLIRRTFRVRLAADLVVEASEYIDSGICRLQFENFIHFLLHFHYQTQALWANRVEDLGDYPMDVDDKIQRMLKHIAKISKKRGIKFATDLKSADENVKRIDDKYKFEVKKQLMQRLKSAESANANLDSIREEDDGEFTEDEESEEDDDEGDEDQEAEESEQEGGDKNARYVDALAPEEIHVHVDRKYDENDQEFDREYEKLLADSIQLASLQPKQSAMDLTVPPSVRQKFERKVNFAGESAEEEPSNIQMALMTRSKGKPTLKPVHMQVSQRMKDSWDEQRKYTEQERKQVKEITLQMNERIQQRVEEETLQGPPQVVPNRFIQDPADCHIPAGPRQSQRH